MEETMKNVYHVTLTVGLFICGMHGLANATSLIISGVIDGPLAGGTPKAVEFHVLNDIADLSIYGFGSANNGGGSDGEEFHFTAVPAVTGNFLYLASESTEFLNFFGFLPDYISSTSKVNGDDAVELFRNGTVVDVFGDINVDGTGQPWEYLDGWAYRNSGSGGLDTTQFALSEWYFSGPNGLDGEVMNSTAANPFPIATYSTDPLTPLPTPEPVSMLLFSTGLIGLAGSRILRKRKT
jgi:hypothetical protein